MFNFDHIMAEDLAVSFRTQSSTRAICIETSNTGL
jgi:hypothetical protein